MAQESEGPILPAVDAGTVGLNLNLLWIVLGACLVIFMQAGFALVETGFCRAKHAAHVVSTNFMIFGLGFAGFFVIGFPLMFGGYSYPGVGSDPDDGCAYARPLGGRVFFAGEATEPVESVTRTEYDPASPAAKPGNTNVGAFVLGISTPFRLHLNVGTLPWTTTVKVTVCPKAAPCPAGWVTIRGPI